MKHAPRRLNASETSYVHACIDLRDREAQERERQRQLELAQALALAEAAETQRVLEAQKAEAERKRIQELLDLAEREEATWRWFESLIGQKQAAPYAGATKLLISLRDLANYQNQLPKFQERLLAIKEKYVNLYEQWESHYGKGMAFKSIMAEIGYLGDLADYLSKKGDTNIIIFGHSQDSELDKDSWFVSGTW